jgi:hypothetical protein
MTGVVHTWQTRSKQTTGRGKKRVEDELQAVEGDEVTSGPVLRSYGWRSEWLRNREYAGHELHVAVQIGREEAGTSGLGGNQDEALPSGLFARSKRIMVQQHPHERRSVLQDRSNGRPLVGEASAEVKTKCKTSLSPIAAKAIASTSIDTARKASASSYDRARAMMRESAALPTPDRETRRARIRQIRQGRALRS